MCYLCTEKLGVCSIAMADREPGRTFVEPGAAPRATAFDQL